MLNITLHDAVIQDEVEYVKSLLSQSFDLNVLDSGHGYAPLHWAVACGNYEMVKLLLEAGADPNIFSSDGMTPMWSALDWGLDDIAVLLRAKDGSVKTNHSFDRTSWSVFKEALGKAMPRGDN